MSNQIYNLADTSDDGNIPAGVYLAELRRVKEAISRADNKMWAWTWRIENGDYDGEYVHSYTVFLDSQLWFLKHHLEAFGCRGEVDIDTDDFIGRCACVIVEVKEITDKDTNEQVEVPFVVEVYPADKYEQLIRQQRKPKEK